MLACFATVLRCRHDQDIMRDVDMQFAKHQKSHFGHSSTKVAILSPLTTLQSTYNNHVGRESCFDHRNHWPRWLVLGRAVVVERIYSTYEERRTTQPDPLSQPCNFFCRFTASFVVLHVSTPAVLTICTATGTTPMSSSFSTTATCVMPRTSSALSRKRHRTRFTTWVP